MDEKINNPDSFFDLMADFLSMSPEERERAAKILEPPEPDYPDGDEG